MVTRACAILLLASSACGWSLPQIPCQNDGQCPTGYVCNAPSGQSGQCVIGGEPQTELLTVHVASGGTVSSSPAGISCPVNCTASFATNAEVTLSATPTSGYQFSGWSGACSGAGTCTVEMTSAQTVTGTFATISTPMETLTLQIAGNGTVTIAPGDTTCSGTGCTEQYPDGTQLTLTAAPAIGSVFSGYGGACNGTTCVLTLDANQTVTATFTSAVQQTLTVAMDGLGSGIVTSVPSGIDCVSNLGIATGSCSASFNNNTQVTFSQQASSGSIFEGWGDDCTGSAGCSFILDANTIISASFFPAYSISVTVTGTGTVTSSPAGINCTASGGTCASSFTTGTVVLTAAGSGGESLTGWTGCSSQSGNSCTVLLMSPATSVSAAFADQPVLTLSLLGDGTGSVTSSPAGIDCPGTCSASFPAGTTVYLNEQAGTNSEFTTYGGACSGTSCSLTLSANETVTAYFAALYTLTVDKTGCGEVTSTPTGLDCSYGVQTCTETLASDAGLVLSATACGNTLFEGFSGDCTGASCSLVMSENHTVNASFGGFTLSNPDDEGGTLSMVPGEARTLIVTVTQVTGDAALTAVLSLPGLDGGVTASFNPTSVTGSGIATLTVTAPASAPLGTTSLDITGTAGTAPDTLTETTPFTLQIRSPNYEVSPYGLAIEANDANALLTGSGRLDLISTSTKAVVQTIADLPGAAGVAIESGGATALVVSNTAGTLVRVNLSTGATTTLSSSLVAPQDVALGPSGSGTALVTDCGPTNNNNCASGRLASVNLATGAVTTIAGGIANPHGIALSASGLTALVSETTAGSLAQITLSTGAALTIATGLASPTGVLLLEPNETNAIVAESESRLLTNVALATGTLTHFAYAVGLYDGNDPNSNLGDIALRADGHTVLFTYASFGNLEGTAISANSTWPVTVLAPARQSSSVLTAPWGVAIEPGGATAVVSDTNTGSSSGELFQVALATGLVSSLASGLGIPHQVAITPDGSSALFAQQYGSLLSSINLSTQGITTITTALSNPIGLAIEDGGATALVVDRSSSGAQLERVVLDGGALTKVGPAYYVFQATDIAIEPGGETVLVGSNVPADPSLGLFQELLDGGPTTDIAAGVADGPDGVAVESGGATALVTGPDGRISRVNLSTGSWTVLGSLDSQGAVADVPGSVAIEDGGQSMLTASNGHVVRFSLNSGTYAPQTIAAGLTTPNSQPVAVALEAGGTTALFSDCSGTAPFCGVLWRASLSGAAPKVLASGFNTIGGIAPINATTALITDCGATASACTNGRLLSVNLSNGASTQIINGLNTPLGITLQSGGQTALVAEFNSEGPSSLLQVTLATGAYTTIASGGAINGINMVVPEANGTTALIDVAGYGNGGQILRVDLTTGAVTPVSLITYFNAQSFAIEPGGATALIAGSGAGLQAMFARLNLTTGGLDILSPGLFNSVSGLVLNPAGTTALFSEAKACSSASCGAVFMMGL